MRPVKLRTVVRGYNPTKTGESEDAFVLDAGVESRTCGAWRYPPRLFVPPTAALPPDFLFERRLNDYIYQIGAAHCYPPPAWPSPRAAGWHCCFLLCQHFSPMLLHPPSYLQWQTFRAASPHWCSAAAARAPARRRPTWLARQPRQAPAGAAAPPAPPAAPLCGMAHRRSAWRRRQGGSRLRRCGSACRWASASTTPPWSQMSGRRLRRCSSPRTCRWVHYVMLLCNLPLSANHAKQATPRLECQGHAGSQTQQQQQPWTCLSRAASCRCHLCRPLTSRAHPCLIPP